MTSILQGDLADEVTAALDAAGVPYALTVTRIEPGEPDPETPWIPGEDTPVPHACSGWVDQYALADIDGTTVLSTDTRVMIVLSSLDIEPTTADTITVSGVTYTIISVRRDAAGALWDIQGRA